MNKVERIKELIEKLNEASMAYYQEDREIMSNLKYDGLYDELCELEKETGIILSNSPTINVGYELLSELKKEAHPSQMLSLDKTKEVSVLKDWLGDQKGLLSWKLDGLTVVLTYSDGKLIKAVTRGNGEVGEVITNNAKTFKNIPNQIPYKGELVIRGEAVIKYSDFNKINESIEAIDAKYKNPRNLCSGSVRQLNNEITAKRNVNFFAFNLVDTQDVDFNNSCKNKFIWLKEQGFDVVEFVEVTRENLEEEVMYFANKIPDNDIPSDGLVILYDDIAYGKSLGTTAKFPKDSLAFKWSDETATTKLIEVEWSPSRTGLINPVAVFEPVSLEGTSVSRASLHNISIIETLGLGEGDEITVYKANMIIPQVAENLTRSNKIVIPDKCPACHAPTVIDDTNGVKVLYCSNDLCSAKKLKLFSHFVTRNAMNIDGLSEATLEKFIDAGFLNELSDIYKLSQYKEQILEGNYSFKQKSYDNLMSSIETSKNTTLPRIIYSLGILNIGLSNAKLLCKHFKNNIDAMRKAKVEELTEIDGIGDVIARFFVDYFNDEHNNRIFDEILSNVTIENEVLDETKLIFNNMNFVVTGKVNHFANRDEVKEIIESKGGKVTGSVTSKTNYLINNDVASNSSKNKKAKELGIPIISEEDFVSMLNE